METSISFPFLSSTSVCHRVRKRISTAHIFKLEILFPLSVQMSLWFTKEPIPASKTYQGLICLSDTKRPGETTNTDNSAEVVSPTMSTVHDPAGSPCYKGNRNFNFSYSIQPQLTDTLGIDSFLRN